MRVIGATPNRQECLHAILVALTDELKRQPIQMGNEIAFPCETLGNIDTETEIAFREVDAFLLNPFVDVFNRSLLVKLLTQTAILTRELDPFFWLKVTSNYLKKVVVNTGLKMDRGRVNYCDRSRNASRRYR